MSERSERQERLIIPNGRAATEAGRARGSTLGGLLLEKAIVPAPSADAWNRLRRESET